MLVSDFPRHDPELSLLALVTTRPVDPSRAPAIAVAAAGGIDWPRLLRLVERHRIAPLAFDGLAHLQAEVPENFRRDLRAAALRDRAGALRLVGVLAGIQHCLADAGIEAVSIKGPTLATLAFGDPSARHCRDLDILIEPCAIERALAVLATADFTLIEPEHIADAWQLALWVRLMKDLSLRHEPTGTLVELHWRLSNNPHLLPRSVERSRQTVRIGSTEIETLAPDDLLLYLCVHGAKHLWFRLKWLADVHALLVERGPTASADFFGCANACGLRVPAGQMLLLIQRIYGLALPDEVAAIASRSWRTRLLDRLAVRALSETDEPDRSRFTLTRMVLAQLLLRSSPRYLMRELGGLVVDWPTVFAFGGTRWSYVVAIVGRPGFWIMRKIRGGRSLGA